MTIMAGATSIAMSRRLRSTVLSIGCSLRLPLLVLRFIQSCQVVKPGGERHAMDFPEKVKKTTAQAYSSFPEQSSARGRGTLGQSRYMLVHGHIHTRQCTEGPLTNRYHKHFNPHP